MEVIQVESTPWQRRKIKKELETLPDDVHFVGTKAANIARPKTGHHYLSEVLVMSRNPFTGVKTSQELNKLGQGSHKHVYDFDHNRLCVLPEAHGPDHAHCLCQNQAFGAGIAAPDKLHGSVAGEGSAG